MSDAAMVQREFPDFDLETLPTLPDGFTCAAWHNDSCPAWYEGDPAVYEAGKLMIAVDYADPNLREFPEGDRFSLHMVRVADTSPEPLLSSDEWTDIEIAVRFIRYVRQFGLGFHPDTRGKDYVDSQGSRCFTDSEAAEYDAVIANFDGDAYETAITVWKALNLV